MRLHSTNHQSAPVSFREAVIRGLAPDGGLWMMDDIPRMPAKWIKSLPSLSLKEIAYAVASQFLSQELDDVALRSIIDASCTFGSPLKSVDQDFVLELFHGPTLAFKDFGARFLANVMGQFARSEGRDLTVIVATSGDTGGAVAHAFAGVKGTRVFVLYREQW